MGRGPKLTRRLAGVVLAAALAIHPVPCAAQDVRPSVEEVAVDGAPGQTTYRLKLVLDPSAISTCYSIFGDGLAPMTFPAAYQVSRSVTRLLSIR